MSCHNIAFIFVKYNSHYVIGKFQTDNSQCSLQSANLHE